MSTGQDSSSTPTPAADPAIPAAPTPARPRRTWMRFLRRTVLVYVIVPYVSLVILGAVAQRWLIYQPKKTSRLEAKSVIGNGLSVEDVALHAANGLTLNGWRFHARATADQTAKWLVLYFPGNAGCRADRVGDCRDFTDLGCDVLLFDYRGYGDNGGAPSETLLAADARRAWLFATGELQFPPSRIVIFGESLGGAVATRLAAEFSLVGDPPAALILNSTFASLGETVAWHYPMFPFQYLLLDRFPSVDRIRSVTCPVLQFHGTADDVVAYQQGRRLFDAAPAQSSSGIKKEFVTIPDGQHNYITMGDMRGAVLPLLERLQASSDQTKAEQN